MKLSLRIAVADDEPELRRYYALVLSRLGHVVVSAAANGEELVEHCLALQPDLVVTDLNMPQLDGLAATRQIVLRHPLAVVLVSGLDDQLLLEHDNARHVHAHLTKPITKDDLAAAIRLAMERFIEQRRYWSRTKHLPADSVPSPLASQAHAQGPSKEVAGEG